jgi:hypothetical protein
MRHDPERNDHLTFETTGREIYANCGIIGLSADLEWVSEGYDGVIEAFYTPPDSEDRLTPVERRELADYMMGLWQRYAREGLSERSK